MIKAELPENRAFIRTPCLTCGDYERPNDVAAFTAQGQWVCERCLEAGPEAMRETLRQGAARLRAEAEMLEDLAAGDNEVPTLEEFDVKLDEVRKAHYADMVTDDDYCRHGKVWCRQCHVREWKEQVRLRQQRGDDDHDLPF